MDTFLGKIAQRILSEHPTDTDRVLVVFNNHRSEMFLNRGFKEISSRESRTFFLPQTITIDDLVERLSRLHVIDNEFLLFELYNVHVEIGGEERKYRSFEDFISFGDLMISDFSEIDRYCVDAQSLFVNLGDLKMLDEWDVEDPNMTPFQQQYLQFYRSLYTYYDRFRKRLIERGEAYSGMAYRLVAEHPEMLESMQQYSHIYFVGFNALSECERRIIGHLDNATLITDADSYYFDDPMQEAGMFLRRHASQFPELKPSGTSLFAQGHKEIHIIECPEQVLQCKYAGHLLLQTGWINSLENTAVVLADEKNLLPLLNSLPDSQTGSYKVNISMGYPYTESSIHPLVGKTLALYRRYSVQGFFYEDIIALLSDPLINRLAGTNDLRLRTQQFFSTQKRIRCQAAQLQPLLNGTPLAFLFPTDQPSPDEVIDILLLLCKTLLDSQILDTNKKEKQALAALTEILQHLQQLQQHYHFITHLDTLARIYDRLAQRHSIALMGEPLSGLQILGMLEARNLDFDNIILLSANEGTLPANRANRSLIPYTLKRHLHLPTYEEQDSIYAYHFYRLLQRAKQIYILYTTELDTSDKREPSRLVRQVATELATTFPNNITLDHYTLDCPPRPSTTPIHTTNKTPHLIQQLIQLSTNGLSPTAINLFLSCPLRFYHEKILHIQEPEPLTDELSPAQLGSHVHNILQQIYSPHINQHLTPQHLQQALDALPQLIDNEFHTLYNTGHNKEGHNYLSKTIAEKQIRHLLTDDLRLLQQRHTLQIVDLEPQHLQPLTLFSTPDGQPINIIGRPDRIDKLDNQLRIIDYKTGSLKPNEINVGLTPDPFKLPAKWLQLMAYAIVYHRNHPFSTIQLGIFPLSELQSTTRLATWKTSDGDINRFSPNHLLQFQDLLTDILADLLDPNSPFIPTPMPVTCQYCPIRNHCPDRAPSFS